MADPNGKAEFIEYNIRKYYNFREQTLTHAQVEESQKQVDIIAQEHFRLKRTILQKCQKICNLSYTLPI